MPDQKQQEVHPAAVAQEFMKRSDMKGGEVEAFTQTFNWLAAILQGELRVLTAEEHEDLLAALVPAANKEIDAKLPELTGEQAAAILTPDAEVPVLKPLDDFPLEILSDEAPVIDLEAVD